MCTASFLLLAIILCMSIQKGWSDVVLNSYASFFFFFGVWQKIYPLSTPVFYLSFFFLRKMPPKAKAEAEKPAAKKPAAKPSHPPYVDMIKAAISHLQVTTSSTLARILLLFFVSPAFPKSSFEKRVLTGA